MSEIFKALWMSFAIAALFLLLRANGFSILHTLAVTCPTRKQISCALILQVLLTLIGFMLLQLAPDVERESTRAFENGYGNVTFILYVASVVVLAPLTEEIYFRGLLQPACSRTRMGSSGAIVLLALLFASLHLLDSWGTVVLLINGIGTGVARYLTGSTSVAVLMHAAHNVFVVVSLIAAKM
jgi:membrane protease YdiL (CAAX protease family)